MAKFRFVATATGVPHDIVGQYLVSYDPDVHEPGGEYIGGLLSVTFDVAKATEFSIGDAMQIWRSGPSCACHCTRSDGQPNRPLTAFTVAIG